MNQRPLQVGDRVRIDPEGKIGATFRLRNRLATVHWVTTDRLPQFVYLEDVEGITSPEEIDRLKTWEFSTDFLELLTGLDVLFEEMDKR